jgi:hypothetical protein
MTTPQVAPYGSWKSPITSDLVVSETVGLGQIVLGGRDVYWVEQRPAEGGRNATVRRSPDGRTADITPHPLTPAPASTSTAAALRAKGLPVAYVPFADEQHGFRRAENITRALDSELYFYARVFGFALADPVEPVPIENLPAPDRR